MSKKGRASENSAIAIPSTSKIFFFFFFYFTVTVDDRGTSNGARPTMSYLAKIIFKAWVVSAVDHPWTTLNSVLGASSELQISLLFFLFLYNIIEIIGVTHKNLEWTYLFPELWWGERERENRIELFKRRMRVWVVELSADWLNVRKWEIFGKKRKWKPES